MHLVLTYIFYFGMLFIKHPFHVSVCDINYNEDANTLEVTHKIFLDDLEEALKQEFGGKIDLLNIQDHQKTDEMIIAYMDENFGIMINNEEKKTNFLGKEVEGDAMWLYLEVEKVKKLEQIRINNTILFEIFDDQINLVHVKKDRKLKSIKLTPKKNQDKIKFKK